MSGANTRSVAWFGVGYTSLSVSWLGNWADAWGPYPVEENPGRYYGNGKLKPYREQDPFADATDAELEQLVRDKWDAIEQASSPEKPDNSTIKDSLTVADHIVDANKKVDQNPIKSAKPVVAVDLPVVTLSLPAVDQETLIAKRRTQEDEDLLLLLSEIL